MNLTPNEVTDLVMGHGVRRFLTITEDHCNRSCSKPEGHWPNTKPLEHEVSCIRMALGGIMMIDRNHIGKIIAFRFGQRAVVGRTYGQLKRQLA